MPHTPQTAVVRLIQNMTSARNVVPGDRIAVRPHLVLLTDHDIPAILAELAAPAAKAPAASTVAVACRDASLRARAQTAGFTRFLDPGCEIRQILERSWLVPGECLAGSPAAVHAFGGIGALGLRVTARDLGRLATGQTIDISVPEVVRVDLSGLRPPHVGGRDVFHCLSKELRVDTVAGRALELHGAGLANLRVFERFGLASLAGNAGMFALFCSMDRTAVQELNAAVTRPYLTLQPERGATWCHQADLDLGRSTVTATPPEGPALARGIAEFHGERVDQVILGGDASCGIEVLRHAAAVIKQRGLHQGLVCDLVPDSTATASTDEARELLETLSEAGVTVHAPGTPPSTLVQPQRKALVTTISAPAGAWRAGPFTAAFVACAGMLIHPERIDAEPQRDSKLSGRTRSTGQA